MRQGSEVGKGRFLGASAILLGIGDGGALSDGFAKVLREVANDLHDADAWRKYCEGRAPCTTDEAARVTYNLVRKALGAVSYGELDAKWAQVRTVACTLCALADGGTVKPDTLHAAIRFCQKIAIPEEVPARGIAARSGCFNGIARVH
jgi:hypothetical protein